MTRTRRQFLTRAASSVAYIGAMPRVPSMLLQAAASSTSRDNVLVVVQLSGGNDGLNTVIPYQDDEYYRNRYTLAIPRTSVLDVDDAVGLHPSMTGMHRLLEAGQLAIVNGVGYPNPNRSHFESMDLWHSAHRDDGPRRTGWLARCADRVKSDVAAMHFGSDPLPLALANAARAVPSLRSLEDFRINQLLDGQLGELVRANVSTERTSQASLLTFVQSSAVSAIATAGRIEEVVAKEHVDSRFPSSDLGQKLESVARLIAAEMPTRIYYVTLDGFDTHANQAGCACGAADSVQ